MTIREIATEIAKREGKKSQARIGDIREILGILADIYTDHIEVTVCLIELAKRRAKRKKKA